jgi:pimeloyl-ACP methyl ester carboxylesterase
MNAGTPAPRSWSAPAGRAPNAALVIANAEWFPFARVPASLSPFADPRVRAHERHALAFDPDTAWSRVHVPVLLLAGGHDRSVASIETWPRIEAALKRAANTRYTLRKFPTANHEGLDSVTGNDDEFPTLHRYAPGYHEALLDWLRATLLLGPPVSQQQPHAVSPR